MINKRLGNDWCGTQSIYLNKNKEKHKGINRETNCSINRNNWSHREST